MSSCTTVLISFVYTRRSDCSLAKLAQTHLEVLGDRSREAEGFLNALAGDRCVGVGSKGDVVSWGCVGNYVSHHDFVGGLLPFLVACWSNRTISIYDNVVVMFQYEQGSVVEAYEVGLMKDVIDRYKYQHIRDVSTEDIEVHGGRIRFPVWDEIDRVSPVDAISGVEVLPQLDLEDV